MERESSEKWEQYFFLIFVCVLEWEMNDFTPKVSI